MKNIVTHKFKQNRFSKDRFSKLEEVKIRTIEIIDTRYIKKWICKRKSFKYMVLSKLIDRLKKLIFSSFRDLNIFGVSNYFGVDLKIQQTCQISDIFFWLFDNFLNRIVFMNSENSILFRVMYSFG